MPGVIAQPASCPCVIPTICVTPSLRSDEANKPSGAAAPNTTRVTLLATMISRAIANVRLSGSKVFVFARTVINF